MANIDAELMFCENKAVAASVTSDVIELGCVGNAVTPLLVNVVLTEAMSVGRVDMVKLQSAPASTFAANVVDEITVSTPASVSQTSPAQLAQFYAPIKFGNKYVRLVMTASAPQGSTLSGGKLTAWLGDAPRFPQ
ncbi:MAG: hypothetical protein IJ056_09495 [Acidaminococcaceae bacterium]|nr:hypothetical protein [Acidaminococcaceae bacterium]